MATNTPDKFDILRNIVEQLKGFPAEDKERVIKWACEELGIGEPSVPVARPAAPSTSVVAPAPQQPVVTSTDIKSFVEEKNPQSDMHFAVVVTYFYRFLAPEKKEAITSEELQEATRLTSRARLTLPSKTLSNAVFAGLLDSAGRGLWKINTVGENLVAIVLPGDPKGNSVVKKKSVKKATPKAKTPTKKK
ncbi:MAG: hypothetical protein Q7S84_00065 [bacterium]|nr:hypothetical protein [bacterium]